MVMKPTLPLRGVLLDWAGTTIDYGSLAPTWVFLEIFRRRGVVITADEARGPMGRAKLDHIAAIAALPRVGEYTDDRAKRPTCRRCTPTSCRYRKRRWRASRT
jgi:phosphonoacetaldehyde hydrolase